MIDVAIIGAGVVGGMVARELTKYQLNVCILEKCSDVAMGATRANSAIVHAGFDAKEGSLKAKLNVRGSEMMEAVAGELGVKYKRNGSLVVGFNDEDKKTLEDLLVRGNKNGVRDLAILDRDQILAIEKNIGETVTVALHAPTGAIICPYELCMAAVGNAMDNGAELKLNFSVDKIEKCDTGYRIYAGDKVVEAKYVINCAGVYSDEISALAGDDSFTVHARRGEYMLLDKDCGTLVSHTIFRCPSKMGKGILVSPTVDGNLLLGPTAEDIDDKTDTSTTPAGLASIRARAGEQVSGVNFGKVITSFTGLRSVGSTGDFIINERDGFIIFCDLYNKGLIYRGLRMVNWDPERQTALSDEEVIYQEEHSKLYYMKYYVVEGDEVQEFIGSEENVIHKDEKGYYAVVATTRPETIMGDVAMCINPKDPKNQWLKGKHVIVPKVGRVIPVIEDRYVEIEFGTGCLKVTPAHDVNDYALGQKYDLTTYDIFTADAHVNVEGLEADIYPNVVAYQGMDRFDCRKQIVVDLQAEGLVEKVEDYTNKVGYSERTNVPIEPRLSLQWFIRMQHFADIALPPVMNDDIVFYPTKYKNTYRNWLENIKDWCISRQLWWGHRIPAYYEKALLEETGAENYPEDKIIVAPNIEAAAEKSGLSVDALVQDEGALDTWFSSWLWPISLFDGIENPGNEEINYYYPTADLVTGPDIIFFWVARMIMAGYEYIGKMPFKHVYFTGIVRDKLGRKMSKSLGNSPDPLDLIERFGADGVRMGMMLCAPAGNDILFDDSLCEQGRNFCNKIWNCFRLIKGWAVSDRGEQSDAAAWGVEWFEAVLAKAQAEVADLFSKYRLSEALMAIYKLFCDDFSGWYLEIIKPAYGQPIDKETYKKTLGFLDTMLKLLHPFMPFITEELWQAIEERKDGESLMVSPLEKVQEFSGSEVKEAEQCFDIISAIRNIRAQKNISPKEVLTLVSPEALPAVVVKLANVELAVGAEKSAGSASFIVGTTEYSVPLEKFINVDEELKKLEAELVHQEGFLRGVMGKLNNERFVANAKPEIVELERKKKADAEKRIATLKEAIAQLR